MEAVYAGLEKIWIQYRSFVMNHADSLNVIETSLRLLAYLLEKKFEDPALIGELLLSSLELIRYLHDHVLRKALHIPYHFVTSRHTHQLKLLLNLIFYTEAFLEVLARRLWGEYGKWAVIIIIQSLKACLRFLLLWERGAGLQPFPPIQRLDRGTLSSGNRKHQQYNTQSGYERNQGQFLSANNNTQTYYIHSGGDTGDTLPSPGIDDTPPDVPTPLNKSRLYAESLYIVKPLLHLFSLSLFGTRSWKPWLISAGADIASLYGMGDTTQLSVTERFILKRRSRRLIIYLLRSPFYDKITKGRMLAMLGAIGSTVPGAGFVTEIITEYMAYAQDKYSYIWSY